MFTMPNADLDGRIIRKMICDFISNQSDRSISFKYMGI